MIARVKAEAEQDDWKVVGQKGSVDKKKTQRIVNEGPEKTEMAINVVEKESKKLVSLGRGEITVGSAAKESVCPKDWGGRTK